MDQQATPEIGNDEFWQLYDQFCQQEHLEEFINGVNSHLTDKIREIMKHSHKEGAIYKLRRTDRGWENIYAWLILRNSWKRDNQMTDFLVGDVVAVEIGYDRDVFVTHSPIIEAVSGFLLNLNNKEDWAAEEIAGIFMPLFNKATINACVELRMEKNRQDAVAKIEKMAYESKWPES